MSFATGKLRVLIATTNGPVEVQLLTEEDAVVGRCVACIGGTTETADIAAAYHAFVVRPTGVIEGRFGHSCYRLDVSARIDAGSSWQLGVLAAHALLAAGRLAQENDVADGILWATGSVRPVDLTVGGVSHVPEKLENSLDRIRQDRAAGRPVLMVVPAANAGDVSSSVARQLADLGVELVPVAHAQALLDMFGMKLPGTPPKAAIPASPVSNPFAVPQSADLVAVEAKKPRRMLGWAVAALVLVGIVAAGAFALTRMGGIGPAPQQTARTEMPPSPTPESTPTVTTAPLPLPAPTPIPSPEPVASPAATPTEPPPAEPQPGQPAQRAQIIPGAIPFISSRDRERVRNEYMAARDFKALAMTMWEIFFVTGMSTQEEADKSALLTCEKNKRPPPREELLQQAPYQCDLYASGTDIVSGRRADAIPPPPWTNASVQRPFAGGDIPMVRKESLDKISQRYLGGTRPKALVIAPNGTPYWTFGQVSQDEAMRRSLERCAYFSNAACLAVAVDEQFVAAIPTLASAVGLYQPDKLSNVPPDERADVARRLSTASSGWNAVAVGASGRTGIKVGATSEVSAVQGAIENCVIHDRECRIVVIGPFLVEPSTEIEKK